MIVTAGGNSIMSAYIVDRPPAVEGKHSCLDHLLTARDVSVRFAHTQGQRRLCWNELDNGVLAWESGEGFFFDLNDRGVLVPPRRGSRPRPLDKDVLRLNSAGDVFYLEEDPMRSLGGSDYGFCIIPVLCSLLLSGCVNTHASLVNSYEVPVTVDLKQVMDIVEQSAVRVLGTPVTVTEGAMPSLLPLFASPATIENRHRALEGLGEVVIPHVHCPGSVATVEKLMAALSAVRVVAACISPTRTTTVIQLIDATAGDGTSIQVVAPPEPSNPSVISAIGRLLLERLSDGRAADNPVAAPKIAGTFLRADHTGQADRETNTRDSRNDGSEGAIAVPFVCFAPRTDAISVHTEPDSHTVVHTLNTELFVDAESPISTGYIHVETREGVSGWVKRSELRWKHCPIG